MPVTIKDIARLAGVSHTTVSRALRDHPAIAPDTTARIKQIAQVQGYLPSAVARGLKTRRSKVLGVIVSAIDDPFWSEVLQGIDDSLHPAGYSLYVVASHREKEREGQIVRSMVEQRVDGVILCSPIFSDDQVHLLQSYGLPAIAVNNSGAEGFSCSIFNDNPFGVSALTRHLLELDHRRIAYLGNQRGGRTNRDREEAFRAELSAAGVAIQPDFVYAAASSFPSGGFSGAQHFLNLPERPTAIFCYNDYMAVGVYSALYQAGLRIPEDISVVGFDNITIAAYMIPALTTFHQPKHSLGAETARIMLYLLNAAPGGETTPMTESIPNTIKMRGELRVRASTARLH